MDLELQKYLFLAALEELEENLDLTNQVLEVSLSSTGTKIDHSAL
jgi:hypothetical protein